jgi:hypothetical protein
MSEPSMTPEQMQFHRLHRRLDRMHGDIHSLHQQLKILREEIRAAGVKLASKSERKIIRVDQPMVNR